MSLNAAKYIVHGHVQGVGFRYFVHEHARILKLNGYAKNNYDGTVEVIAEGSQDKLNSLYALLKQGPSRSIVNQVIVEYVQYEGKYEGFHIY